ncbi:hypothetical protein [Lysobacter xanthus]
MVPRSCRVAIGASIALLPLTSFAAPSTGRILVATVFLLFGVVLLIAVARIANDHVQWKRTRRVTQRFDPAQSAPSPPVPPRPHGRGFGRLRALWRVMRIALLVVLAFAALRFVVRPEDYPGGWPWPRPAFARFPNGCPHLDGEYAGVDAWSLEGFVDRPPRAAWRDHYARIEQADDGATLRVKFGLDTVGMRARRGEIPMPLERGARYRGRAADVELREGAHFECRGGWLYSVARHDARVDGTHYVDVRMRRDLGGGLVIGSTTESRRSFSVWAESPGIDLGSTQETTWRRLPPRTADDAAQVRALQTGIAIDRRPFWKGPTEIATVRSYIDAPLCMRLLSSVTTPFGTRRDTLPLGVSDGVKGRSDAGNACPNDAGRIDPVGEQTVPMQGPQLGINHHYLIEWARRDATPRVWTSIRIDDVRALPWSTRCDDLRGHVPRTHPCT